MEFGITLFPDVDPAQKPAARYFRESLAIVEAAEALGFTHVRSIEHHFTSYGGYSPSSTLILAAAAERTKTMRLITGALIPAFNHPLKMAGEIGMLDAISDGRLSVGFGRGFLPHEFRRFGVSRDESVERFREGIEQVDLLLRHENVTHHGRFHSFDDTTSMPRPTQLPRPPFFVAANITGESYEYAGRHGHWIMAVPMAADRVREMFDIYRQAYRDAGHAGRGKVFLAFHMFVDPDPERARRIARPHVESYFRSIMEATKEMTTELSGNYKGYEKQRERMSQVTLDSLIADGGAFVGSPEEVRDQIVRFSEAVGGIDYAALQVNFSMLPFSESMRSLELFAREVIPSLASDAVVA